MNNILALELKYRLSEGQLGPLIKKGECMFKKTMRVLKPSEKRRTLAESPGSIREWIQNQASNTIQDDLVKKLEAKMLQVRLKKLMDEYLFKR